MAAIIIQGGLATLMVWAAAKLFGFTLEQYMEWFKANIGYAFLALAFVGVSMLMTAKFIQAII